MYGILNSDTIVVAWWEYQPCKLYGLYMSSVPVLNSHPFLSPLHTYSNFLLAPMNSGTFTPPATTTPGSICKARGLGYILPTWTRKGEWSKVWSHVEPNKSEIDPSRCDTPRQNHRHLGVRLFSVHFHCVHYQIWLLSFQHILYISVYAIVV